MNFLLHNLRWILAGVYVFMLLIFVGRRLRLLYLRRLYQRLLPEEQRALRKNALLAILCVCVVAGLVAFAQLAPEWQLHSAGISVDPRSAPPTAEGVAKLEDEYRKTILQALAGIFVFVGLYYTHRRVRVNEQGHITERYTKAIEQLGAVKAYGKEQFGPNIEVRLGAIYALERLARDSPRDHWTIMEVLTAYVRENAPAPTKQEGANQAPEHKRLATEIQAILTVLGRRQRDRKREREGQRLDLRGADLRGAVLAGLHFEKADFSCTHLQRANLRRAHLYGAHLDWAHLQGAHLAGANLKGAILLGAQLEDAHLAGAHLAGAMFFDCVGLTIEQFEDARDRETAYFDDDFREELVKAYGKREAAKVELAAQPVTASNAAANADAPEAVQTSTASDPRAEGDLQAPDTPSPL